MKRVAKLFQTTKHCVLSYNNHLFQVTKRFLRYTFDILPSAQDIQTEGLK